MLRAILLLVAAIGSLALAGAVIRSRRHGRRKVQVRADDAEDASIERYELLERGFTFRWQAAGRLADRVAVGSTVAVSAICLGMVSASTPYGAAVVEEVALGGRLVSSAAHQIAGPLAPAQAPTSETDQDAPGGPSSSRGSNSTAPTAPPPIIAVNHRPPSGSGPSPSPDASSPSPTTSPGPSTTPPPSPTARPSPAPSASPSPAPSPIPSPGASPAPSPGSPRPALAWL